MSDSRRKSLSSNEQGSKRPSSSRSNSQNRKRKKPRKRKRLSTGFKVFLAVLAIICFAIAGAVLGTVFGILQGTEVLNTADVLPESYTSIIYDTSGAEFDKLHGEENREYVQLNLIPQNMQDAIIAIEDQRFYEHNGIDMRGIGRAFVQNVKTFSLSQGASTLTQQLIKNEALTSEKKIERKIKEQYLAIGLEKSLTKQLGSKEAAKKYILELYLNTLGLSHGLNGVEAASQYYYGKSVGDLTLAECASIAGITKSPNYYAPDIEPEHNKERLDTILDKMLELGYIDQGEHDSAKAEDVYSKLICTNTDDESGNSSHNYFVEAMIAQIATDLADEKGYTRAQAYNLIYSGGLQIHSTMNTTMQSAMEAAFMDDSLFPKSDGTYDVTYLISVMDTTNSDKATNQAHYERKKTITDESQIDEFVQSVKDELLDDTHKLVLDKVSTSRSLQAAMVIMDYHNGEIKALVGGRGQKPGDSVFNRATQALRQQGSTMKPLASYAPALDTGLLMPGSIIIDEPVSYGSWSPGNWNGRFLGPSTARDGIRNSMNILAVKTFMMVGAETSYKYLENFGFTTLVEADKAATTALGGLTDGVSVLEETAAYAAIANGGTYIEPQYYTVIYDHDGNVLLDNSTIDTHRVIKETTAYMLTSMMIDAVRAGTGGQASMSNMTVSGKTGTTNDTKDLTFYASTPYYTAGIWMGYDSSKVMTNAGSEHLRIWKQVMTKAHEGLSNKSFTQPAGIVTQTYCSASGDVPGELCSNDYYGLGTHSDIAASDFGGSGKVCTTHQTFRVCRETGKLASVLCPESEVMEVVLAVSEDGKIYGKPSEIPEGKMDINISEECSGDHSGSANPDFTDPNNPTYPIDPQDPFLPIDPGNENPGNEDPVDEPSFGIN